MKPSPAKYVFVYITFLLIKTLNVLTATKIPCNNCIAITNCRISLQNNSKADASQKYDARHCLLSFQIGRHVPYHNSNLIFTSFVIDFISLLPVLFCDVIPKKASNISFYSNSQITLRLHIITIFHHRLMRCCGLVSSSFLNYTYGSSSFIGKVACRSSCTRSILVSSHLKVLLSTGSTQSGT